MAQTLQAVFILNDRFSTSYGKILKQVEKGERTFADAEKALKDFETRTNALKNSCGRAEAGIGGLTSKLAGIVSAAYLGQKAFEGMFAAVNISAMQKVQETTFQSLLNSQKIGSQMYRYVSDYAKLSALSREDVASASTSFLAYTRDINQVEQLLRLTERLYAKDPKQGAQGAVFALKEVLSGDTMSIKDRFNMSGISGEKIRNMTEVGDTAGVIAYLDRVFNKFGATQGVVDSNFKGLITQSSLFASNLKSAFGESATPVMEQFSAAMQRLNADFDAGKYQPFINVMVNGMSMIGKGILWVTDNAGWLVPMLSSLVGGLLIYNGVVLAARKAQLLWGLAIRITRGDILGLIGVIGAVVGAGVLFDKLDEELAAPKEIDMTGFQAGLAGTAGQPQTSTQVALTKTAGAYTKDGNIQFPDALAKTNIPVEISNAAPVSVKGDLEVESESLKYFADFARAKFLAMYSTSMVQPQMIIQHQEINQNADWEEGYARFGDMLAEQSAAKPKGVYPV